ncbi:7729_t:CDS:1 [Gigaspora rosea]|nr:7729_t:CDS:1 [Gigaspora rosea]
MVNIQVLEMDVLKQAQSRPILSVYPDQTSKNINTLLLKNLFQFLTLDGDQIETISLCNKDKNHAINQAQDVTSPNTQFSMLKPLQLTSNPSPNIILLSPNPNTSDLDILSFIS